MPPYPTRTRLPAVTQYAQYLKELYSDDFNWPLFPRGGWPPQLDHSECYMDVPLVRYKKIPVESGAQVTSLGGVKQVLDKSKCYSLQQILNDDCTNSAGTGKRGICVLIDGAPGVGKSTLANKACKDWATGKLWPEYKLVVYLPLKDETFSHATQLWQLFETGSEELSQAIAQEIIKVQGEGVLFILDGWDEHTVYEDTSVIKKIVFRKLLRKSSMIITSRPHATTQLIRHQVPDYHFGILGFTNEQVTKIVTNYFSSSPPRGQTLLWDMKERQEIMNLCHIPLNLAIVLHVYHQRKALPPTLTLLYELFMRILFVHQLDLNDLDSLASLPEDSLKLYNAFCKLAFEGLVNDSLIFSDKQLKSICSVQVKQNHTLGLLTAFKTSSSTGICTKYQFTHLTIQEFLAAEHLAKEPEEMQKMFIVEHINNEKFLVTLQFLFGKAAQTGSAENFKELFAILCSPEDLRRFQILLRLAHETQNPEFFRTISTRMDSKAVRVCVDHWSSYELHLLTNFTDYLLWNSSIFTAFGSSRYTDDVEMVCNQVHCLGNLVRQRSVTTIEVTSGFRQLYSYMLSTLANEGFVLSSFEIFANIDGSYAKFRMTRHGSSRLALKTFHAIAALFRHPQLENSNQATTGLSHLLSQGICPQSLSIINCQSIRHLLATSMPLVVPNMTSILECISSGLQELHLTGRLVLPSQAISLFGAIAASSDFKVLDLSNSILFMGGGRELVLEAFVFMLIHSKSLECIYLKECDLDEEVLSLLALHNFTVKILNIDCTHNLPKTMNYHHLANNLSTLYMCHCYIDDEGAVQIGSMLRRNTSLKELYLDRNNITAGGAIHITVGLMENSSLEYLSISRQSSMKGPNDELQQALQESFGALFQTNNTLRKLCLAVFARYPDIEVGKLDQEPNICDDTTKEDLSKAHCITCMHYNINFVSHNREEAPVPLVLLPAQDILSLTQNSSLTMLDLSGHNLTEPTTMLSLVQFLKHNSTVAHLKLNVCRLHELKYAVLQNEFFSVLCSSGTLTDLTVDPESASTLSSLVDKVNYERHQQGSPFLTLHTVTDPYDLVVRMWTHSP